jgi:hypothetical protein
MHGDKTYLFCFIIYSYLQREKRLNTSETTVLFVSETEWDTSALAYVDDVNILGENIDNIQKNIGALLDDGKEVGLEVNSEKTKYMLMSRKKAGQKHSIKRANRSFEVVAKFKYLGTTLTYQHCMQEEIKSRLNSGSACYHSVQSLMSSRLLSRNVKVKIHKTIIQPVLLHGCETWSLTLREEHRERVFENRVLRGIFGPKEG